ncbi:hypothetical protein P2318_14510 [Myxococcaceae bacterium GXIMD 01537]
MTHPAAPAEASVGSRLHHALIGAVLGGLQPPLFTAIAAWMTADGTAGPATPLGARLVAALPHTVVSAAIAAAVGVMVRSAYVKFGRDSLLPITLTYGFLSSAVLLFLFLTPD